MYKTQKKSSTTEPPRTATNFQRPADFSFKFVQIGEKFYKTDATTQSTSPRSTKPENCKPKKRPYVPPHAAINPRWPTTKPLKTAQICPLFLKTDYTMIFYGLRSTKPRNFKTKEASTHPHAPPATSMFIASDSRAATHHLTLQRYDVTDDVILH